MASSLRLINLIKHNRTIYSSSSKVLAQNVRLPQRLLDTRNYGLFKCASVLGASGWRAVNPYWINCTHFHWVFLECDIKDFLLFFGIGNRVLALQPFQGRCFSSSATEPLNTGSAHRNVDKHEFKAETRMLLDIVARSLYSGCVFCLSIPVLDRYIYGVRTGCLI